MTMMIQRFIGLMALVFALGISGCTVIAAADAVGSAAIGITKGAVKTTGAVVGAVIPDGDDEDED